MTESKETESTNTNYFPFDPPAVLERYAQHRGVRNNNAGNIKKSGIKWDGLVEGEDPVFCTFENSLYGIRALLKILNTYYTKYKLKSIAQITKRYAPESENKTTYYIKYLCNKLNMEEEEDVKGQLGVLAYWIISFENGSFPYEDKSIVDKVYKFLGLEV